MLLSTMAGLLLDASAQVPGKLPAQPFKVAVIGDTGYDPQDTPALDSNFEQVLAWVRSEGARMLAIAGDFAHEEETDVAGVYFGTIDRILGEQFPMLGAAGDHDDWSHYQPFFQARLEVMGLPRARIAGPEYGLRFGGIQWAVLGGPGKAAFVRAQFARDDGAWRVCMWHWTMHDMQPGDKEDEMDWASYCACQEAGAIIVTGLGGRSRRDYECVDHDDDTCWATVYTRNYYLKGGTSVVKNCAKGPKEYDTAVQGYTYGALFITFNAGEDPDRAEAYFKTITGETIDTFSIVKGDHAVQQ